MSKNFKSYLKGVTTGYAKMGITILVGLFMVPFTLRFLTRAEYGVFAIAGDILLWLGLLQLGTGASLNSRAAQLIGRGETKDLSELASTAFVLQVIAAILTVVLGGLISLTVDHWFTVSEPIQGLSLVVFMLIIGASIQVSAQVFNGLLIANKQIHVDNLLGMGLFLFRTTLTIIFLFMGMKLMALAWSSLISTTTISVISYIRVKKYMPDIHIRLNLFRKAHVRDLLGNGIWFTIGGLAGILIGNLDRFMVGRFVSLDAVASFIITGKLYFIADKLHQQVFNVMRPYFGQLHGQGKTDHLNKLYHAAFSASLILSVTMACVIYLVNGWFIGWWVGPDFYLGHTVSLLFALNFVLQSSVLPNRILLASTLYRPHTHSITRIIEGGVNLFFTYILVQNYKESGVLAASVIATLALSAIAMNYLSQNYFQTHHSMGSPINYLSYLAVFSLIFLYCGKSFASIWFFISLIWLLLVVGILYYVNRQNPVLERVYVKIFAKNKVVKKI